MPRITNAYAIRELSFRQLTKNNKAEMRALHDSVIAGLPDPAWFFPSAECEFDAWLDGHEAFGYFDGDKLVGFGVMTPAHARGGHSYAQIMNEPDERTFDFHDVLVLPAYRGRGIHTMFLKLFEEIARTMDGIAIYATVDPMNSASWHNFEKAGYQRIAEMPAYDGRMRRYYKLSLN